MKKDWDQIANTIIKDIFGFEDVILAIREENGTVDKFSNNEFRLDAILVSYTKYNYVLFVRKGYLDLNILCHEMIHLKQYYEGRLKSNTNFTKYYWWGVEYDKEVNYYDRPWELEAFKEQNDLKKQYKKLKK